MTNKPEGPLGPPREQKSDVVELSSEQTQL